MEQVRAGREKAEKDLLADGWLARQPPDFQKEVLSRAILLSFDTDEYIYRVGDAPGGIYGLVGGNAAVLSGPLSETPKLMQMVRPGGWTGEGSYLTRQPRLIDLQAKAPTLMMHLPLDQMEKMTFRQPEVIRNFSTIMIHTVHVLLQVVSDLQRLDPARRIAATIARSVPADAAELAMTQIELGEMACASRRQVGVVLKDFSDRGWIAMGYGKIVIRDLAALRGHAQAE